MKPTTTAALLAALLATGLGCAAKVVPPPALTTEHRHPSGAFTFATPPDWKVETSRQNPDDIEAAGAGVRVKLIFRNGEIGYDSLHADCMLVRLAGPMDTDPTVEFEYDFVGGMIAGRRALDSAFTVVYDQPIQGERAWRQRTVTIVGAGQSLCVIGYAPAGLWKESAETRALVNGVMQSVTLPALP